MHESPTAQHQGAQAAQPAGLKNTAEHFHASSHQPRLQQSNDRSACCPAAASAFASIPAFHSTAAGRWYTRKPTRTGGIRPQTSRGSEQQALLAASHGTTHHPLRLMAWPVPWMQRTDGPEHSKWIGDGVVNCQYILFGASRLHVGI